MPARSSNFSRYPIPSDLSPDGVCCVSIPVPDDPQWRAMLDGALWRLTLQTHWERDQAHSAKVVAARWREVWREVQNMSGCCGSAAQTYISITMKMVQNQMYLTTLYQMWVDAELDVQVAFYQVPDDFDADPGDAGAEVAQRDRALCLAVESFVDELMNQAITWIEQSVPGVASIGIGLMLTPAIPFWIAAAGFTAAALALSELHNQAANEQYRRYLVCGMYEELKGKATTSSSNFASSWDNLPIRPPPPETGPENIARDALEIWGRTQINNVEVYLGFVKQLDAAMVAAGQLADEDCSCKQVMLEECSSITYIQDQVLEYLGDNAWRLTAGTRDHPTSGMSDVGCVTRVGGGCFTIDNAVKISGSLNRTSWKNCGGGWNYTESGTPQDKPNVEEWQVQDLGETDGFVIEFDAVLP